MKLSVLEKCIEDKEEIEMKKPFGVEAISEKMCDIESWKQINDNKAEKIKSPSGCGGLV
jgi:hypothetical protein